MVRKLGLVGGVGVIWLLTYLIMGGKGLPSIWLSSTGPSVSTTTSPYAAPISTTTPIAPGYRPPTSAGSAPTTGAFASRAESLANLAPLNGASLAARPEARRSTTPSITFRMATFNVLGNSHTVGSRKRASGVTRMATDVQYLLDRDISVVGFQEMQGVQRAAFLRGVKNTYGLYPGGTQVSGDGDNSIAWRLDTWQLIRSTTVPMLYFYGSTRNIPVLLLRNKQTGITAYFTNFHNPADKFGPAQQWRNVDKQRQVALFQSLAKSGYPVFVTGDMNEHLSWACDVVGPSDMRVAVGGDGRNGCTVTANRIIDWIAASYDVQFSNFVEDQSSVVAFMTDHPVMFTDVTIDSRDFPKSVH